LGKRGDHWGSRWVGDKVRMARGRIPPPPLGRGSHLDRNVSNAEVTGLAAIRLQRIEKRPWRRGAKPDLNGGGKQAPGWEEKSPSLAG